MMTQTLELCLDTFGDITDGPDGKPLHASQVIRNLVEAVKGYMGHERFATLGKMLSKNPERVIENAVYGMLPKTALGRQVLRRKLRVFAGAEHSHVAQQPTKLSFKSAE